MAEVTSPTSYLDHSRDGRGNGGFYLLGLLVILMVWIVPGSLLTIALAALLGGTGGVSASGELLASDTPVWKSQVVTLLPFALTLVAVLLTVRIVLGRPARTVVTGRPRVSVGRMAYGGAVYFGLLAVATLTDAALRPDTYTFTFAPERFLPALVVVLLLVPVQSSAEELLFRGYIVQWTTLATDPLHRRGLAGWRRTAVLAGVSGLVFALPHLANPEAQGAEWYAWLVWFFLGAGWACASVLDGRIELAIGAHIANNVFGLTIAATSVSAVETASVWTSASIDWPITIVTSLVVSALFVLITCRGRRPPSGTS